MSSPRYRSDRNFEMASPLLVAVQTLTRLPAPSPKRPPDARALAWSGVFYPLVGALLGGVGVGAYFCLGPVLPRSVVMLLILALWALLTGALHEDGLADTFDAFGSRRSREDVLRVLKDSRVGSYGSLALILATLLRWQGLTLLDEELTMAALVAMQVLPRAGIVLLAYLAGAATTGLGGAFAASLSPFPVVAAMSVGLGIAAVFAGTVTVFPALAAIVVAVLSAIYFKRRIGGVTGDCLGAAAQLQEVAILLALLGFGRL